MKGAQAKKHPDLRVLLGRTAAIARSILLVLMSADWA